MATQPWKNRSVFFKSDQNLTAKEKEILQEVLRTQEAQTRLAELKRYVAHHENDGSTKSIIFLEENFKNMTTFLRVPGVQSTKVNPPQQA